VNPHQLDGFKSSDGEFYTKTDVLWCSTTQPPPDTPLSPVATTVSPAASVRNLGVLFDRDLSLTTHVNQLTAGCYSSINQSISQSKKIMVA